MSTIPSSLVRFEAQLEQAIARRRRRRRMVGVRVAVAATAAAAVALGAIAVPPGDDPSAVALAASALEPAEGTILHVVATSTATRPDGSVERGRHETWQSTTPPYDTREISGGGERRRELGRENGAPQFYDPATNTIQTTAAGASLPEPSLDTEGEGMRERIRVLLRSGGAREDGRLVVDGRDAIRIVAGGTTTLLVDAETYLPIRWRAVADDGTVLETRFETYERLPATEANRALLSLRAQHPDAPLARGGVTIENG